MSWTPPHEFPTEKPCPTCGTLLTKVTGLGTLRVGVMLICNNCGHHEMDVMENIRREQDAQHERG